MTALESEQGLIYIIFIGTFIAEKPSPVVPWEDVAPFCVSQSAHGATAFPSVGLEKAGKGGKGGGLAFRVTVFRGGRGKAGKGGKGGVFPVFRRAATAFTSFPPFSSPVAKNATVGPGVSRDSFPRWPKKSRQRW